jgi:hypothetical protein
MPYILAVLFIGMEKYDKNISPLADCAVLAIFIVKIPFIVFLNVQENLRNLEVTTDASSIDRVRSFSKIPR